MLLESYLYIYGYREMANMLGILLTLLLNSLLPVLDFKALMTRYMRSKFSKYRVIPLHGPTWYNIAYNYEVSFWIYISVIARTPNPIILIRIRLMAYGGELTFLISIDSVVDILLLSLGPGMPHFCSYAGTEYGTSGRWTSKAKHTANMMKPLNQISQSGRRLFITSSWR